MASIFKGENWEVVSTRRAKKLAREAGKPEGLWELFLMEANQQMIDELLAKEKSK